MRYTAQESAPNGPKYVNGTYYHGLASQFVEVEGCHHSGKCGECAPDCGQGEGDRIAHTQIAVHDHLVILDCNNASHPADALISTTLLVKGLGAQRNLHHEESQGCHQRDTPAVRRSSNDCLESEPLFFLELNLRSNLVILLQVKLIVLRRTVHLLQNLSTFIVAAFECQPTWRERHPE